MKKQILNSKPQVIKNFFILFVFTLTTTMSIAQNIDYNNDDYIANGYDVVNYFSNKVTKGNNKYVYNHNGAKFRFSSSQNLETFKQSPDKYTPQYGGWCAYAIGDKGKKVSINPKTFEIRNGKLYLFYNAYFTNTFESWKDEGPEKLKAKADKNWEKIKYKN